MLEVQESVQLLHCSVEEDDESYFRFLCDGGLVKYVTIAPGLYSAENMCFAPALIPMLPPFPIGNWNDGYISPNPEDGTPFFSKAVKEHLPGVRTAWHSTQIDHLELTYGEKLRSGVYKVTTPHFPSAVVAKFARFAWEIDYIEDETTAYQWIEGQGIGPEFLGHIVEEGRVIGFMMEHILDVRHATPEDLEMCQGSLGKLHQLGILHGDTNKFNFLIQGKRAMLVDFDCARKCEDAGQFESEMQGLVQSLSDTSGRGGSILIPV